MYHKIKKLLTLTLLLMLFGVSAMAQDVIILKNGNEIKSLVHEVGPEYVLYKKWENQTGPSYYQRKDEVLIIMYQNGTKEIFNEVAKPSESNSEQSKLASSNQSTTLSGKRMFANPDGSVSFEGSDYRIYGKDEMQNFLLNNCRPAYDQYTTGKRLAKSGGICLAVGIPLSCASIGLWFLPYSLIYGPIITGGLTGMWIGGAINLSRGNRMVNGAFDTYNRMCASSKNYSSRLELGLTGNGIGMLLTF